MSEKRKKIIKKNNQLVFRKTALNNVISGLTLPTEQLSLYIKIIISDFILTSKHSNIFPIQPPYSICPIYQKYTYIQYNTLLNKIAKSNIIFDLNQHFGLLSWWENKIVDKKILSETLVIKLPLGFNEVILVVEIYKNRDTFKSYEEYLKVLDIARCVVYDTIRGLYRGNIHNKSIY
jgi:hypothetical protein